MSMRQELNPALRATPANARGSKPFANSLTTRCIKRARVFLSLDVQKF